MIKIWQIIRAVCKLLTLKVPDFTWILHILYILVTGSAGNHAVAAILGEFIHTCKSYSGKYFKSRLWNRYIGTRWFNLSMCWLGFYVCLGLHVDVLEKKGKC